MNTHLFVSDSFTPIPGLPHAGLWVGPHPLPLLPALERGGVEAKGGARGQAWLGGGAQGLRRHCPGRQPA